MIFVVFGYAPFAFNRLANEIDAIAENSPQDFLVQCGHTDYPFRHARAVKYFNHSEMRQYMERAELVISHGGCGTLSEALKTGKKVIAVPRLEGEHNHSQRELVAALEKEGYLLGVYDIAELENQIKAAGNFIPQPVKMGNAGLLINEFISNEFPDR
jgi:UDP-N-acetylglucosamine transferase subunit ALG13